MSAPSTPTKNHPGGTIPPIPGGPTGPAHSAPHAAVVSPPVHIRIPAIGVSSGLQRLHRLADGELQSPSQWQVAGWYAGGIRPGAVGPAVIAGHIDSVSGPAVFYRLTDLHQGDRVFVTRADGSTVTFRVGVIHQYPKAHFPTQSVYGPTPVPVLRLVTCTGKFDYAARSYLDNLVVTAYLAHPDN